MSDKRSKTATRRFFLKGAAGASLALPFLSSLAGRSGHAQSAAAAAKKRILFVYMPHQETDGFDPDPSFGFTGSYLAPLATNHKARLLVLDNMNTSNQGQGHNGGHTEWLTGFPSGAADFRPTQGPSMDVYLAKRLSGQTPMPLLNFSMSWRFSSNIGVTSWNEGPTPTAIPAIGDTTQAFTTVFGTPGASTPTDQGLARRGSLLDALMQDYTRVNGVLSAADRRLLDQHTSLIRDQEALLQQSIQKPFTCSAPGAGPAKNLSFQDTLRSYMDSIVGAFRCDATRVATLQFGCSGDDSNYSFVNPAATNYHNDVAHGNPVLVAAVRKWQMQQIAYLCDQMAAVPDGNGSLLDNTLIAVLTELGFFPMSGQLTFTDDNGNQITSDNNHLRKKVPALLIGSSGGYFKTGRFLDMKRAHYHDFLLTLGQAMGFTDLTAWGQFGKTPLSVLRA